MGRDRASPRKRRFAPGRPRGGWRATRRDGRAGGTGARLAPPISVCATRSRGGRPGFARARRARGAGGEARRRGAFMLKVEPNVPDGDPAWLAALARLGFRRNRFATHPRRSWVLDIRPSEADLLASMKEKWRYNIRLAGRKGVQVREVTAPADVDTFYTLYQETAT